MYSTYIGGTGFDAAADIAFGPGGTVLVVGSTSPGVGFPTTPGAFDAELNSNEGFVAKLSVDGSQLLFSTFLGGEDDCDLEGPVAVAVDVAGNAFVTGFTSSPTFPTTPDAFDTSYDVGCSLDGYVTKLNSSGSVLVYSTYLSGESGVLDAGLGIAVDESGSAYVVGTTQAPDFPTTPGAFDTTADAGSEAFVTKLDATGSTLVYSTYLGGNDGEAATATALDRGNVFVSGGTSSTDFPSTAGAFDESSNGQEDAFLTVLNGDGSALVYSSYFGGTGDDFALFGLGVDDAGNAVFGGYTHSVDLPTTPGAFDNSANGLFDAYLARLSTVVRVPSSLTLSPAAATNVVGTSHTVTASVEDGDGEPVENVDVRFAVTGAVATSGQCTTGTNGECTFAYDGPALPGSDSISAYADSDGDSTPDAGEPTATASKAWVLPASTPPCRVSIGEASRIVAANGDRATMDGSARVSAAGVLSGRQNYRDTGPGEPMTVRSISVLAVVCSPDRRRATIYGKATIDGAGSFDYRIEAEDNRRPGKGSDRYGILLSSGYDSGLQLLAAGDVTITD